MESVRESTEQAISESTLAVPRVQQLGVDARGLYALEYLLFEENSAAAMRLANDARGARVRAYAVELSANISGYAERIQRSLGDGQSYATSFAKAGKLSVDTLVSQTLDTLTIVSGKFSRVERARTENRPLPFAVEGAAHTAVRSALSCAISAASSVRSRRSGVIEMLPCSTA